MELITGEIAAAIKRAWGRGPVATAARWAGPNLLVVLMRDAHTEQERTLCAAGCDGVVLEGRGALRRILEPELRSIVQRGTGREVTAVLGGERLEPDLSTAIFMLAPRGTEPVAGGP